MSTDTTDSKPAIYRKDCNWCLTKRKPSQANTLQVLVYDGGSEVERCINCDVMRCPHKDCVKPVHDPSATTCPHCNRWIRLKDPKA